MDRVSQRETKRETLRCSVAKYVKKNFFGVINFNIFSNVFYKFYVFFCTGQGVARQDVKISRRRALISII